MACVKNVFTAITVKQLGTKLKVEASFGFNSNFGNYGEYRKHFSSVAAVKPFSEIPGPFKFPVVGSAYILPYYLLNVQRSNELLKNRFEQFGPIFRDKIFDMEIVYLNNLDDVEKMCRNEGKYPRRVILDCWRNWRDKNKLRRGILTEDGINWKKMRQNLDKHLMTTKHVSTYVSSFNEVSEDLIARIDKISSKNNGLVPNIDSEFFHWSLETAGTVLYEVRFGGLSDSRPEKFTKFIEAVQGVFTSTAKIIYTPESLNRFILPKWQKLHDDSWGTIFSTTTSLIDEKVKQLDDNIKSGNKVEGFLAHLLSTEMQKDEIYANITEIMLGAVDTTSMTMQWVLYELAKNPHIQEQLYEELKLLPNQEVKTFNDLGNLSFLKAVVKEILRLYPIAMIMSRIPDEDMVLSGYEIPKNTTLMASMFLIGRNEDNFKDPLSFKPHRWLRNQDSEHTNSFAWLPFGFGSRACIGRRLAELELYLLISKLVRKYRFETVDNEPILPVVRGLLSVERPVNVKFVKRNT